MHDVRLVNIYMLQLLAFVIGNHACNPSARVSARQCKSRVDLIAGYGQKIILLHESMSVC
jgi:hypothetical protein